MEKTTECCDFLKKNLAPGSRNLSRTLHTTKLSPRVRSKYAVLASPRINGDMDFCQNSSSSCLSTSVRVVLNASYLKLFSEAAGDTRLQNQRNNGSCSQSKTCSASTNIGTVSLVSYEKCFLPICILKRRRSGLYSGNTRFIFASCTSTTELD